MKAAVVGGGIAGLVAANELARGGAEVTLHERSDRLGGRAASDDVASTRLNRGPHALYRAGAAISILRDLRVRVEGETPDLHRFDIVIDDTIARAPTTPWATATADYMSFGDKLEVARFIGALFRLDPAVWDERPFAELVDRYATSTVTRRLLAMTSTISTFGRSPRLSAGTALRQVRLSLSNVLYLTQGWQSIVEQLASQATRSGVHVELRSRVDEVGDLDADVIVLAVAPDAAERLTGADFGPRRPTQMATLDLVMHDPPRPARNTFDVDRGVFLSFHPHGAVHGAKYLDPFEDVSADEARAEIETMLDLAQPGWRSCVDHQRYMPQMNVNGWFADAGDGGVQARPPVQLDARTFLAGDWVGSEGYLADAAVHSAHVAATTALALHSRAAA